MIGIISQNNILTEAIIDILQDFSAEIYQKGKDYQLILLLDNNIPVNFKTSAPIIALGCDYAKAKINIPVPIHPKKLIQKIVNFLPQNSSDKTFENNTFIFYEKKRSLEIKKTHQIIPLTEKENELLSHLAKNYPHTIKREDLLKSVWNYHQNTETHTVESHIYALRQKLGKEADELIQSSPIGYSLVAK